MKRRSLLFSVCLLLVITLILAAGPGKTARTFAAESDFNIDENGVLTAYNGDGGDIVVPDGVKALKSDVFDYCDISSITFPSSLEEIGSFAFYASSIESLTIPASVKKIGDDNFIAICRDTPLKTISVEAGNSVYDSRNKCNAVIETATNRLIQGSANTVIPNGVESIGEQAFFGIQIEKLVIPTSVKIIEYAAFYDASNLKEIHIPKSVEFIYDYDNDEDAKAFRSCNSLEKIYVEKDSYAEKYVQRYYPDKLVYDGEEPEVWISNQPKDFEAEEGETAKFAVTAEGENLTYLWQYKKMGTEKWTDWTSKKTAAIDVAYDKSRYGMELRCKVTDSKGNEVISDTVKLTYRFEFVVENGVLTAYNGDGGDIVVPDGVKALRSDVFDYCDISSITLPSSLEEIGSFAFYASSIESLTIPASVKKIGDDNFIAICRDTPLKTISVEAGNSVYDSRNNCNAVIETATNRLIQGSANTVIPKGVESIGAQAFYGIKIEKLVIPTSVKIIEHAAFYYASNLKEIHIPESVEMFLYSGCYEDTAAFHGCNNLEKIYVEKGSYAEDFVKRYYPNLLVYEIVSPDITKQPVNVSVEEGKIASFSVTATGKNVTYLWQYRKKSESDWTDWTTKTTANITVAYDKTRDGMYLRCKLKDADGKIAYTDIVTLTYKPAGPKITKQPVNATVNAGTVADFSLTATGTKLTYLWQYKKKGATSWTDWSTKTTAAITVAYDKSRDGMSLRCKLTDGNGNTVYSNTVTLTYKDGPVITKQPVNATVNTGTIANFSLTATGTKLTYLWQYKKKGATSWTNWSTKTTAAITVAYDKSRDGMSLRCKLTDGNGNTVYSNTVTLTYKEGPVITKQPVNATVNAGTIANFSLTATGTKLTYLWQYKKKGATSWTDWSTKTTAAITVAYDKSRDGMSLRCKLTDGNGKTEYSSVVTLTYKDGPVITKQPVSATVNAGTLASFSLTATGTKVKYLWQYKKAGATGWTDWTTKTTADITVAYDKSRDGMSLRCKLTDDKGNTVYSDVVTLKYVK